MKSDYEKKFMEMRYKYEGLILELKGNINPESQK